MMLPGHSVLMRLSPHIAESITTTWWWNLFVARYFVWLLVALNVTLLFGLREAARNPSASDGGQRRANSSPSPILHSGSTIS